MCEYMNLVFWIVVDLFYCLWCTMTMMDRLCVCAGKVPFQCFFNWAVAIISVLLFVSNVHLMSPHPFPLHHANL